MTERERTWKGWEWMLRGGERGGEEENKFYTILAL